MVRNNSTEAVRKKYGYGYGYGKNFNIKYGYGYGYGLFFDPEVRKDYGLKLILEFKYGYGYGYEKIFNLKYGYGFRTRLRTPGYGLIFGTSWRVAPSNFFFFLWGSGFCGKKIQKYRILHKGFLSKILVFSEISFKGISFGKWTPPDVFEQNVEVLRKFVQNNFF